MALVTSQAEVAALQASGRVAARALALAIQSAQPGATTNELNHVVEEYISTTGARASFKGFEGYPTGLCVSINEQVVHGIPSDRVLQPGDVVGLDVGVDLNGWFTDTAVTIALEPAPKKVQAFLKTTGRALDEAIRAVQLAAHIGDIGAAVQRVVEPKGYGIITQLVGHGVGRAVHEPPQVPNVGRLHTGPPIKSGMVLAIEPMLTIGEPAVHTEANGWTVSTDDGSLAAHFEHTVVLWDGQPIVLTARS